MARPLPSICDEGFKSVVLGGAAGEIGSFLNQLSGLLVCGLACLLF